MSAGRRKRAKQDRSLRTYNALLDAAERLLKKMPWEKISTSAIMAEAGVSSGAIYGRFKKKDDLLIGLYERHDEQLKERHRRWRSLQKDDLSPMEYLDREIGRLIEQTYENRWLLREMGLLSRIRPEVVSEPMRKERARVIDEIVEGVLSYEEHFNCPDPKRSAELMVFAVGTLIRESILYQGPHFETLGLGRKELKETAKRIAASYLGIDANGGT